MHRRRFIALLGAAITAARTLRAQQAAVPEGWKADLQSGAKISEFCTDREAPAGSLAHVAPNRSD